MTPLPLLSASLFVTSFGPAGGAGASPVPAAVICAGNEIDVVAELQASLLGRLGAYPGIALLPPQKLATVSGVLRTGDAAGPASADPALQAAIAEATTLLDQAKAAYYEDRTAMALERLGGLASLQERFARFPVTERIRMRLWRAAVFLAAEDEDQARAEAREALVLGPDLTVPKEFRPSVRDLVERARATKLPTGKVTVVGLPAGAKVTVDDRPVDASFTVPLGRHTLVVSAPGRREVARVLQVDGDLQFPLDLPYDVTPALEKLVGELVWSERPPPAVVQKLSTLGRKLGVEWMVFASARKGPDLQVRAALIDARAETAALSLTLPFRGGVGEALGSWLEGHFQAPRAPPVSSAGASASVPSGSAGPPPASGRPSGPLPTVVAASSRPGGVRVTAEGGVLLSLIARELAGKDGGTFKSQFFGVGPAVAVEVAGRGWLAATEVGWANYGLSTLDTQLSDGSTVSVKGGSTARARVLGGYRHLFGQRDSDGSPALSASMGFAYERGTFNDLTVEEEAANLLPSHQSVESLARLDVRIPIGVGRLRLNVVPRGEVRLVHAYTETPAAASGKYDGGWAFGGGASIELDGRRSAFAVRVTQEVRGVAFTGDAKPAYDPPLVDSAGTDAHGSVVVSFRYRF